MGRISSALFIALSILVSAPAFAGKLQIGYNEAWIGQKYQTYLTNDFDANEVTTVFRNIKAAGGSIVRLWFFQNRQGLILNRYAPQTSSIDPQMLANIATTMTIAEQQGLQIYFTLFDGNSMPGGSATEMRNYFYNLLNNKYGELDAFKKYALLPVLKVMAQKPNVIYALDLMNEIEAPIYRNYFPDSWKGPRTWMKSMRDFIRVNYPALRVTSSAGWGWGPRDVEMGLFSGLGLDFYDIHVYDNYGNITRSSGVCKRAAAEGLPVILGEFGQAGKYDDDNLQRSSTLGFLRNAEKSCFSAALAWRFDSAENYWRFQRADGSFRPAVEVMKGFNLTN